MQKVHDYWQAQPCGTQGATASKFSFEYFEEIERHRYAHEPEIFSFAQFTRHHGQRVLEIGIGAGTDLLQWVRAGAETYGVDLTPEAVEHARARLGIYGLSAREVRTANCEELPYGQDFFDLVYSWGVLHHTSNTSKAIEEVVRVTRPGGKCKIMLYNRHSLTAFYQWCKWALLKGRPWKSVSWCLSHCVESPGTRAFTKTEVQRILRLLPTENLSIRTILTQQDRLYRFSAPLQWAAGAISSLSGRDPLGWYMTVEFEKSSRR